MVRGRRDWAGPRPITPGRLPETLHCTLARSFIPSPPLPLPAHLLPVFSHLSAAHPISFGLCEGSTPPVVNHPESRPLHRAAEAPAYPPARFRRRSLSGQEERGPTTRAHTSDARHFQRCAARQLATGAPPDDPPKAADQDDEGDEHITTQSEADTPRVVAANTSTTPSTTPSKSIKICARPPPTATTREEHHRRPVA